MMNEVDRIELAKVCMGIAKHFDGWVLEETGETFDYRWKLRRNGMEIGLSLDWSKKDRLNIATWAWPKYTKLDRGEVRSETITPSSLYDPKESRPSISVAWNRGPEVIAKEIKRRFLPEYERIYARCAEKAASYQKHENESRANWQAICSAIKVDPNHNRHYVTTNDKENRSVTIENRNGSAYIETYCNADQLVKIIAALKGTN
jgi:hypothetical protein